MNKKWREIIQGKLGTFELRDVVDKGLELSTRKCKNKLQGKKLEARKSTSFNVMTVDRKLLLNSSSGNDLFVDSSILTKSTQEIDPQKVTWNRSDRKSNTAMQDLKDMKFRSIKEIKSELKVTGNQNRNQTDNDDGKSNGIGKKLLLRSDRKWLLDTTKSSGVSPKGKVFKRTPGKTKRNLEKIKRQGTVIELEIQPQVRPHKIKLNPFAVQDLEKVATLTNSRKEKMPRVCFDMVTGNVIGRRQDTRILCNQQETEPGPADGMQ